MLIFLSTIFAISRILLTLRASSTGDSWEGSCACRFLRDSGTILHTWSGYGPVIYLLRETDILLDLTPLGRQHEDVQLLHHGKYPEGWP